VVLACAGNLRAPSEQQLLIGAAAFGRRLPSPESQVQANLLLALEL